MEERGVAVVSVNDLCEAVAWIVPCGEPCELETKPIVTLPACLGYTSATCRWLPRPKYE